MQITKYILSISIPSLIFLAGCDKVKELQNSITPSSVPTVIAKKLDFQTTENTGKFVINPQFSGASNFSEGLAAVLIGDAKTGKWGFMDKNIKFIINPQFSGASNFSEGLAAVLIGDAETGNWGFIDKQGKMVINPQFSIASQFSEGLAAVPIGDAKTGTWGFINKQGKTVVNPQFSNASQFSDGLAAVLIGDAKTGKWGYIDKQGKMVVNPQFEKAGLFTEGLAAVQIGDEKTGKWGFIDKQGKMVINPQFSLASQYSEGLAAVRVKDIRKSKYHVGTNIDGNNDIHTISSFYETTDFDEPPEVFERIAHGLLRVTFNSAKAFEQVTGVKSPFDYLYIKVEFNKIVLCWGRGEPNISELIKTDINVVATWGAPTKNTNLNTIAVGMIDLIAAEFKKIQDADSKKLDTAAKGLKSYSLNDLSSGLIPDLKIGQFKLDSNVRKGSHISEVKGLTNDLLPNSQNSFDKLLTWGFVNKKFDIAIKANFDEAKEFSEGLAPVLINNKWGFIDKQGIIVINPAYQNTFKFTEKLAPVLVDGKWGFISR